MTRRPVVGVAARPGETAPLRRLARALSHRVDVRAAARCEPDAVLATSRGALSGSASASALASASAGRAPVAVWDARAQVIETDEGPIPCSVHARDLRALRPHGPLVRRRWRQRRALPDRWVVVVDEVGPTERVEAIRLAQVVAVTDPDDLVVALALGTPSVTTPAVAAAIGAGPDQVVVAAADDLVPAAEALADDPVRAATLARLGRAHAKARLDLTTTVAALVDRLGLGDGPEPPPDPIDLGARVDRVLTEMGTPAVSRIRTRAAHALHLPVPSTASLEP